MEYWAGWVQIQSTCTEELCLRYARWLTAWIIFFRSYAVLYSIIITLCSTLYTTLDLSTLTSIYQLTCKTQNTTMAPLTAVIRVLGDGSEISIVVSVPSFQVSQGRPWTNLLALVETSTAQRWLANLVSIVMVIVTTVHRGATMYFVRAGSNFLLWSAILVVLDDRYILPRERCIRLGFAKWITTYTNWRGEKREVNT